MRKTVISLGLVLSAALLASPAVSAPFEPLFRVSDVQGDCKVMLPEAAAYGPVENGKAYPFGSQITTPDNGKLTIVFAANSECMISGGARLKVAERPDDKGIKQIYIEQGRIDTTLDEGFESANGLEIVAHCSTITCLKGGKSFVDAKTEQDLHTQLIGSVDTELRVKGPQFDIAMLKKDQWVSISCASDRRFVRVKDVKGEFETTIQGSDGQAKPVPMQVGCTVKIMQKASEVPGSVIVAILVVGADGTPTDSVTYSTAGEGPAEPPPPQAPPSEPGATTTTTVPPAKEGEWEPMWSATTTTSTTTTTRPSIPPPAPTPTPVGRR